MHIKNQENLDKWLSYQLGDLIKNPWANPSLITILGKSIDGLSMIISRPSDRPSSLPLEDSPLTYHPEEDVVKNHAQQILLQGNKLKKFLNYEVMKENKIKEQEFFSTLEKENILATLERTDIKRLEYL